MKQVIFSLLVIYLLFSANVLAANGEIADVLSTTRHEREYWQEVLTTADVFSGATADDFINPEPGEDSTGVFPLFVPWEEVFSFPVNNKYSVGVAYNKNASPQQRYAVSAGDPNGQNQSIVYYDVAGKQTWGCYQQNSEGWGLRDLAYDEAGDEYHGGGNQINRRQVFLDDCSPQCDEYLPEFLIQRGTAHEDGGSEPDSVWTHNWGSDFGVYSIDRPVIPEVTIDIKPQSCPNPLNVKSQGVLPAAVLGTENFDVNNINVESILLQGIAPIRSAIQDVATPVWNKRQSDLAVTQGSTGPDMATLHSCTFDWVGYLMSNSGRGNKYGIAVDETGVTGEPWVLWISYQNGPGGNRLEARRRDGSVIGYQSLPGVAGGLDFTDNWEETGKPALIYLEQYTPDEVHVYQPETTAELDRRTSVAPQGIFTSLPIAAVQSPCECTTEGPDGYDDLTLKFKTQEIVEALGEVSDRDTLVLTLTFRLTDGMELEGSDCVIILKNVRGRTTDANSQLGTARSQSSKAFTLSQNYPNPVINSTAVRYALPVDCYVTLEIYHVTGRRVLAVVDGPKKAGCHRTNLATENLPAGVYFCWLRAGDFTDVKKMILMR